MRVASIAPLQVVAIAYSENRVTCGHLQPNNDKGRIKPVYEFDLYSYRHTPLPEPMQQALTPVAQPRGSPFEDLRGKTPSDGEPEIQTFSEYRQLAEILVAKQSSADCEMHFVWEAKHKAGPNLMHSLREGVIHVLLRRPLAIPKLNAVVCRLSCRHMAITHLKADWNARECADDLAVLLGYTDQWLGGQIRPPELPLPM
jgi:hypothetical protein